VTQQQPASGDPAKQRSGWRQVFKRWRWLGATLVAVLLALVLAGPLTSARTAGAPVQAATHDISGAGKTIIEGGTGGATPVPVTTLVAFHASAQGGHFECLALAPSAAKGPGSGDFTVNAMYVTGTVSSMETAGNSATLNGTATVTGLGAGQNQPFTVQVSAGGPGATIVLTVSGLTFHEILVEGNINLG
jgi:hypothetical protein